MAEGKIRMKYSFPNNLRYLLRHMWQGNAKGTALTLLRAPFIVAIPLLGLWLSRSVVLMIQGGTDLNGIVLGIAGICAAIAACTVLKNLCDGYNIRMEFESANKFQVMVLNSMTGHDYEYNESPQGLNDSMKAMDNVGSDNRGARRALDSLSSFAGNTIGILTYAAVILALNPVILLAITGTTVASYFLLKRITAWSVRNKDNWLGIDRKIVYLENASKDLEPAKDIRLYNMAGWLRGMFGQVVKERLAWRRREGMQAFGIDMLCAALSFLREGVAYGLLIYMMYQNGLPVADFVLYFGVIGGFTAWVDGLTENLYWFDLVNVGFNEMRAYLEHGNQSNRGAGIPVPEGTFPVEFRDVSYSFAGSDRVLLRDFNLKIRRGEKVAIVGLNGAGKTTLVKLLCGLYRPTGGEILADGKPIDAYNIDDYHGLFAAVFQEITLLPMTVRQNIACRIEGIDEARLAEALRVSGFGEVADKLDGGLDTYLVRGLYPGSVDLSGGETQKLALARALYRGGKFLILDEPTAALDPIAESNVYEQYNRICEGKTSVFISHRLASTRFCDRILFLEDGRIAEEGTHDELIARRGKYYELFEVQSHYYREEAAS